MIRRAGEQRRYRGREKTVFSKDKRGKGEEKVKGEVEKRKERGIG